MQRLSCGKLSESDLLSGCEEETELMKILKGVTSVSSVLLSSFTTLTPPDRCLEPLQDVRDPEFMRLQCETDSPLQVPQLLSGTYQSDCLKEWKEMTEQEKKFLTAIILCFT